MYAPKGTIEYPINSLELMLAAGATFLARGFSHGIEQQVVLIGMYQTKRSLKLKL